MSQYAKPAETWWDTLTRTTGLLAGLWNSPLLSPTVQNLGIRGAWSAFAAVRNFVITTWDPAQSDIRQGINVLIDGALRNPTPGALEDARRRSPANGELWDERYDPPLDLGALEKLPRGTLGHEYALFIRDNGIEPLGSLVAWGGPKNLLQYVLLRAYKLHDVLHVVLGCPATPLGEVQIVSFSVGQGDAAAKTMHAPALALAVVLLHIALRRPQEFAEAARLTGEWTRIGQSCRPYTEFRLEAMMDRPVEDVRAEVLASAAGAS
jgi:ubiquinone biosynthesis protein Coq4